MKFKVQVQNESETDVFMLHCDLSHFYGVTFKAFVTTDLPHLREMPNFPRKDGDFVTRI